MLLTSERWLISDPGLTGSASGVTSSLGFLCLLLLSPFSSVLGLSAGVLATGVEAGSGFASATTGAGVISGGGDAVC